MLSTFVSPCTPTTCAGAWPPSGCTTSEESASGTPMTGCDVGGSPTTDLAAGIGGDACENDESTDCGLHAGVEADRWAPSIKVVFKCKRRIYLHQVLMSRWTGGRVSSKHLHRSINGQITTSKGMSMSASSACSTIQFTAGSRPQLCVRMSAFSARTCRKPCREWRRNRRHDSGPWLPHLVLVKGHRYRCRAGFDTRRMQSFGPNQILNGCCH